MHLTVGEAIPEVQHTEPAPILPRRVMGAISDRQEGVVAQAFHSFVLLVSAMRTLTVATLAIMMTWVGACRNNRPVREQAAGAATLEATIPPGYNYDRAEFRLWLPAATRFHAIVVLVPGSNADGRPEVDDPVWQAFATKHQLALVGVRFTDKPPDRQDRTERYAHASQGSGQALVDALTAFAAAGNHPELATAPLLLWGMSAGGQFNYEFVHWKPERVVAFVVNKGGVYYTALTSQGARNVPGLLFVGGKDLNSRAQTIAGLFALNRRAGALWALSREPSASHVVGRSRDLALLLFEDMLAARLSDSGPLRRLNEQSGFSGDLESNTFRRVGHLAALPDPTAWLPNERVARAWRAIQTEMPFD